MITAEKIQELISSYEGGSKLIKREGSFPLIIGKSKHIEKIGHMRIEVTIFNYKENPCCALTLDHFSHVEGKKSMPILRNQRFTTKEELIFLLEGTHAPSGIFFRKQ